MSVDEIYSQSLEFLEQKDFYKNASQDLKTEKYLKKIISVEQDRLSKFSEIGESNQFFFGDINYEKEILQWKENDEATTKENLEKSKVALEKISDVDWTEENLEKILLEVAEKPARNAMHPPTTLSRPPATICGNSGR